MVTLGSYSQFLQDGRTQGGVFLSREVWETFGDCLIRSVKSEELKLQRLKTKDKQLKTGDHKQSLHGAANHGTF